MKRFVLYDENCSLCVQSKSNFEKLDWFNRIQWISLQNYEKNNPSTFKAVELRKEIHLLIVAENKKKVLKGFFAIRSIFMHMPLTIILGIICYLPGAPIVGKPLYSFIAKNRYRINKKTCNSDQCKI